MKTFEKLQQRIENDTGIKLVAFRRIYAGKWQREAGNWVWTAHVEGNEADEIGSCWSATNLLKEKKPLLLYKPGFPQSKEIIPDN